MGQEISHQPIILAEGEYSAKERDELAARARETHDIYESQLAELAEVTYPDAGSQADREDFVAARMQPDAKGRGSWVFFPWSQTLIHMVNQDDFEKLLTNRNQLLITATEQAVLATAEIALFGLSVGNGIALACVHSGIGRTFYLADPDTFDTTNMNRVRVGLSALGRTKLETTVQQMYEVNPFIKIQGFPEGIAESSLKVVVESAQGPLVIFDEMDDFMMKVKTRAVAKAGKRPVVMLSSLGDTLLIDVERYDTEADTELFNGRLDPAIADEIVANNAVSPEDEKMYATAIVGRENVPEQAVKSLQEIGKTLVGRPQLYSTVSLDGGFGAFIARNIILEKPMPSGRYKFAYADIFKQ